MWVKNWESTNRWLLPGRSNTKKILVSFLNWKFTILALSIQRAGGATADDNDDDYYTFDASDEYDPEEEERLHEIIVDEWYNLIRYEVGLSICIFGLIGLYFHQYASYHFLKRYTRPRETEHRRGRVVVCEPILRSTSTHRSRSKNKKKQWPQQQKKKRVKDISVPTSGREIARDESTNVTDYVLEKDLESDHVTTAGQSQQECTVYRMLVVYKVLRQGSGSMLCCNPSQKHIGINCTNSFSVATCASGISGIDNVTEEVIYSYRSRSLPYKLNDFRIYEDSNGRINDSMDYMNTNEECEYFQWFETATRKEIDTEVDLILLKGQPTSACTLEVLESHLSQVGKSHEGERDGCCNSISLMGAGLVVAVLVLSLVCAFEIHAMPNPETQRPVGYTVLGGFFAGSFVSAYLFAGLLFEQYKQKVFLSAFTVPPTIKQRRLSGTSVDTGIVTR